VSVADVPVGRFEEALRVRTFAAAAARYPASYMAGFSRTACPVHGGLLSEGAAQQQRPRDVVDPESAVEESPAGRGVFVGEVVDGECAWRSRGLEWVGPGLCPRHPLHERADTDRESGLPPPGFEPGFPCRGRSA